MYIIKNSSFDLATGGSPILSYLPQNLRTVLLVQEEAVSYLSSAAMRLADLDAGLIDLVEKCRANAVNQHKVLEREVEKLQAERLNGRPGKADLGEAKILQRCAFLKALQICVLIFCSSKGLGWLGWCWLNVETPRSGNVGYIFLTFLHMCTVS